jgi:hypothetical protein
VFPLVVRPFGSFGNGCERRTLTVKVTEFEQSGETLGLPVPTRGTSPSGAPGSGACKREELT